MKYLPLGCFSRASRKMERHHGKGYAKCFFIISIVFFFFILFACYHTASLAIINHPNAQYSFVVELLCKSTVLFSPFCLPDLLYKTRANWFVYHICSPFLLVSGEGEVQEGVDNVSDPADQCRKCIF